MLAEAKNLQNYAQIVGLQEALRSAEQLDDNGYQKLFWSLKEDYHRRTTYLSYLTRSRQRLLVAMAHFESLQEHYQRDKTVCNQNLVALCVRQFLEEKERTVQGFVKKFQQLTVSDEKAQYVDRFINFLFNSLENDNVWQTASEEQIESAKQIIERQIMSQVYMYALYPNGDGDVLRDQILHQHLQYLSKIVTPNHKDLRINKIYHLECPWPAAQAEILAISVHKTPRDKVRCVVRCCTIIMNLLSLANDKSVPAADDLMPVLVFVIIKASPVSLLSTVQYVNSFYEKQFEGEDAYWWTQFCSAIEFIKTME